MGKKNIYTNRTAITTTNSKERREYIYIYICRERKRKLCRLVIAECGRTLHRIRKGYVYVQKISTLTESEFEDATVVLIISFVYLNIITLSYFFTAVSVNYSVLFSCIRVENFVSYPLPAS